MQESHSEMQEHQELVDTALAVVRDSAPAPGAVYAAHFGLRTQPFGLTPDPAFLYLGPAHREALAAVEYGLVDRRGFITMVGEVGTGKTTLLYSLLNRLRPEVEVAYVNYTRQSVRGLLSAVLGDLGIPVQGTSKAALILTLNRYLRRRGEEGGTTAIVIDEAQNLSDRAFEELRLLSNFETYTQKLIQIVLVGQPELEDRLRQPHLRQLQERVSVRTLVNPLPNKEMRRYIEHRLQLAGGSTRQLFTLPALNLIIRRAAGIPRRANILCHNALLFAYGRNRTRVTMHFAREAIAEMAGRRARRRPVARRSWIRRAPAARWIIASCVVAMMVALFMFLRSSPISHPSIVASERSETAPDRGEIAPTHVFTSADPGIPTSDGPEQDRRNESTGVDVPDALPEASPPHDESTGAKQEAPRMLSVVVPRGASVLGLLRRSYGKNFGAMNLHELMAEVRRLNPRLKDPNVIFSGDSLIIPPLSPDSPSREVATAP